VPDLLRLSGVHFVTAAPHVPQTLAKCFAEQHSLHGGTIGEVQNIKFSTISSQMQSESGLFVHQSCITNRAVLVKWHFSQLRARCKK